MTDGGAGPCYGFTSDDGVEYSLYSEAGFDLPAGRAIEVQIAPAAFTADCGAGMLVRLLAVADE